MNRLAIAAEIGEDTAITTAQARPMLQIVKPSLPDANHFAPENGAEEFTGKMDSYDPLPKTPGQRTEQLSSSFPHLTGAHQMLAVKKLFRQASLYGDNEVANGSTPEAAAIFAFNRLDPIGVGRPIIASVREQVKKGLSLQAARIGTLNDMVPDWRLIVET